MSLFRHAVVYLLVVLLAFARSRTFATIVIKPARSDDPRNARVRVLPNGDLIASTVPVITLLSLAYDLPVNPSPLLSGRSKEMIRGLLADRFKLLLRVENRTMSVYALTVASGGPKLQKSAVTERDCLFNTAPEGCHNFAGGLGHPLNAKAIDMDDLVHYIRNWTDLPVVNRSALSGLFTVNTEGWVPMRLPPPPPNATPGEYLFAGLPTIFTVLGRLGLELKRQEDVLTLYTVERIERPAGSGQL